ncbi:MAG: TolC family protein [Candidatus Omnitrophota bacterium]|nr:MAG: TolC family protein [Candidatus Omnitrophota bacterium]
MKKRLCLVFILFFFPCVIIAAEVSLTLDEAIALALRDNRDILLKAQEVRKSKEKIREARSGFLPTLQFTASSTDTRGYYSKDLSQSSAQFTAKEYLYNGGKTKNTVVQNKAKLAVSEALLDKAKLEAVLAVKKAFYTLLLAEEYAGLNKKIKENSLKHLTYIQARYQNGQASQSDILKIEESMASVQEAYEASLHQIESTQTLLRNLLFLDKDIVIRPQGNLSFEPRDIAYEEAFLKAMQERPEIRQYLAQEKADRSAIEVTKADSRPQVYASWDYYSRSHVAATTTKNWNDYSILGITFTWPFFDGWATRAKVEQAIIDLKETGLTTQKTQSDIALELKNACIALNNAISKLQSLKAKVVVYKDTLAVVDAQYNAGIASHLDLDDVSLGYVIALFNQKEAMYDYGIAKAKFDKATGGM